MSNPDYSRGCDVCTNPPQYYTIYVGSNNSILSLHQSGSSFWLVAKDPGTATDDQWRLQYITTSNGRFWYILINNKAERGALTESAYNMLPEPGHYSLGYSFPIGGGAGTVDPTVGPVSFGLIAGQTSQVPYIAFGNNYTAAKPLQIARFNLPYPELFILAGPGTQQQASFNFTDPCLGCTYEQRRRQCLIECCRSQPTFDQPCISYLNNLLQTNSQDLNVLMADRCRGDNLNNPECKIYCDESNPNTQGRCTSSLREYCSRAENYGSRICGCFLPEPLYESYIQQVIASVPERYRSSLEPQLRAAQNNPACFYPGCQRSELKGRPCLQDVNVATCIQGVEINAGPEGVRVGGNINIDNTCILGGQVVPPAPPSPSNKTKSSSYIIIPVIIIILFVVGYFIFYNRS